MRPLEGVRVVDLTDGRGEGCGRFLADLGAEVLLVEPPGGVSSRQAFPMHAGQSLNFVATAANKHSIELDLSIRGDRERFLTLLAGADIWIDGTDPGTLAGLDLAPRDLRARFPHLVIVSITAFGQSGPYRDWVATDWVHLALTPSLSRSGLPGRPPLMPPGAMADVAAGAQAAWVALLAYWNRLETGIGDHLDLSVFEAAAQILDPSTGMVGTAEAAQSPALAPRGRPLPGRYPIIACADGHVRIVVVAPRQWRGMFSWLAEPEQFADPKYDLTLERFAASAELLPLIEELFRDQTMFDLVDQGQRRGVPIAPVLASGEVLDVEHFRVRETFVDVEIEGSKGRLPSGYLLIDGERAGARTPAPDRSDASTTVWDARPAVDAKSDSHRRPLVGLRVLDLGVIVMGAEAGRLFADQGADVIKVENRQFPDGSRAFGMTASYASGHRNKRGIGINLRDPQGVSLFEQLVSISDVVLTNFKPGTIESLGIGFARLAEINPGIVLVTSSALGEWGPWRDWMGYGPLVRCVSGLTDLWRDPSVEDGFGDATTIYPDHLVGRIVDVAALAALIARRSSGRGAHIESSQAEAIITAHGPRFLLQSLEPEAATARFDGAPGAPWGVYPCAGDDEWCVITVTDDDEWGRLVAAVGSPPWATAADLKGVAGRVARRFDIDQRLGVWTSERSPDDVSNLLQARRVPAAPMRRAEEFNQDIHLLARGFFRTLTQPGVDGGVAVENGPCIATNMPEPELHPAPTHGQNTREIGRDLLGLSSSALDDLIRRGVLEE
jgi:crotonobetainyl-CoA:carnitine CoA-transferase CaiB-like acyl-CoA transferase